MKTSDHFDARPEHYAAATSPAGGPGDEMDFFKLWDTLWRSRALVIGITATFVAAALVLALALPPWYRASVLLAPAKQRPSVNLTGGLAGLASIAGLSTGDTGNVEAVAVLKSRDFAREFIEDEGLIYVLFADDWDATARRWAVKKPPDIRRAVEYFDKNVRKVQEDRRTGLVTLQIDWKDPQLAARWANLLAARLNSHMRGRALKEAEANLRYLRHELESTPVVALQQSISQLLETEMEKMMLARGNAEYAFRTIDRAEVPRTRERPKRTLIVALAILMGGMTAVLAALIRNVVRKRSMETSARATAAPPTS